MNLIEETTSSSMDLPQQGLAPLDIHKDSRRVRAMFAGHVIADSDDVLILHRPGLPDRRFFPRTDVETGYLGQTRRTVSDPDLGAGVSYTCVMDGRIVEDAVYAFDNPPPAAEALAGRLCLSPGVFEIYELTPADLEAAPRAARPHGGGA